MKRGCSTEWTKDDYYNIVDGMMQSLVQILHMNSEKSYIRC